MKTTTLCIVRHAETAWNAAGRVQGQLDVPLSEAGLVQARALAALLANESFAALYCSDLVRVRQTALPLAARLKKEIILDERLRERHYGVFQGMTYAQAKAQDPEGYARFKAKDLDYDFRTGESMRRFNDRVLAFFRELIASRAGEKLIVFTHGGVLEMLYRHATGRAISARRDFEIPNAALNRVEIGPQGWRVLAWAEVSHLPVALDDLPD